MLVDFLEKNQVGQMKAPRVGIIFKKKKKKKRGFFFFFFFFFFFLIIFE